jgi:hypothetical protein
MAELYLQIDDLIEDSIDEVEGFQSVYGVDFENTRTDGANISLLVNELRFLGVAYYVRDNDVQKFNEYLFLASKLMLRLLSIPEEQNVSRQKFVLRRYQELLTAMSCGCMEEAIEMAKILGYRPEIEKQFDDELSQAIGYTLKKILHDDPQWTESRLVDLKQAAIKSKVSGLSGIGDIFAGILSKDQELVDFGFEKFLQEYKKQCKGRGMFKGLEDEMLCVWGIGLANLVIYKGMEVNIEDELMPRELFINAK